MKRPASVAELTDLVKATRAAKHGVYPLGGRTTLDVGQPPIKPGIAIDITALNRVIDYPARDMTITVQAGITLAALQAELAKEGQWLPVDVALPEKATLGGALALNQSGPRRYGYGTLRDYVIGISFITDDGVEVRAGGRVVKNVAGYDLMKLQIGAVGTLGVITQVTLKVKPKPEASVGVCFGCATESLTDVLDRLHASRSRPIAVELLNADAWLALGFPSPAEHTDWVLAVRFEEKTATAQWQRATLQDELKSAPVHGMTDIPDASALWQAITALQLRPGSRFIGKRSVLPSKVAQELTHTPPGLVHAHALNGIIWFHGGQPSTGTVVRRCPPDQKEYLAVWGNAPSSWELMRHVKQTLDPDNVFNPGRLFGDL